VANTDAAIASLKASSHFDRILTSGSTSLLQHSAQRAAPEIKIVAGGALDAHSIENLMKTTSIREFHVGRAARFERSIDQPVDPQRVKDLVRLLAS
jgi:copper homeostasis protein CutC